MEDYGVVPQAWGPFSEAQKDIFNHKTLTKIAGRHGINANLTEPEKALWVTLTYAENMRDAKQLYEDFRRFWQRFRYYLDKHKHPTAEYITAAEPQARGAWHLHCLFLFFPEKAPFIPNSDMAQIWRHGFTKTKSL